MTCVSIYCTAPINLIELRIGSNGIGVISAPISYVFDSNFKVSMLVNVPEFAWKPLARSDGIDIDGRYVPRALNDTKGFAL